MLEALGVESRKELIVLGAILLLVAVTPLGKEATHPLLLVAYRLLLISITVASLASLKRRVGQEICPIFAAFCGTALLGMLISMAWNPGSTFDALYRWYQHLFFGAAFLAMAALHRHRSNTWKLTILAAVASTDVLYLIAAFIDGSRPLQGPFVNPNYFASFLLVGFAASGAVALFGQKAWVRTIAAGSALFLYYGMTQAWSRGATISAAAITVLAVMRFARNRGMSGPMIGSAVVALLMAGAIASPTLVQKFTDRGDLDPYNYQRPKIWLGDLRLIAAHPLLGVGLGQFYYVSKRFSPAVEGGVARYLKRPGIAHSEYLQYAAEVGLPTTMLMVGLAGYLVLTAMRRARACTPQSRVFQEAAILVAAGLGTHALVDNNWTVPVMASGLVVFSLADVLPVPSIRFHPQWNPRRRAAAGLLLGLAVLQGVFIPGLAIYFNETGHSAHEAGDLKRAESFHRLAAAIAPNHDLFLDNAGLVYLDKYMMTHERRWLEYAESLFRQALAVNPNADLPGRHLETLLFQRLTGNLERDRAIHQKIVEIDRHILTIDPFNPFVRKNLAEALYLSGQRDQAQREMTRTIEIEPNYVPAYLRISDWFRDDGDLVASDSYREKALAVISRYRDVPTREPYEALLLGRPQGLRKP